MTRPTDADLTHAGFSVACNKCGGGTVRLEASSCDSENGKFPVARLVCVGCRAACETEGPKLDLEDYGDGDEY